MAGDRPIRLLQLTDSHLRASPDGELKGWRTRDSLARSLDAALAGRNLPDAILATGDLSQDGTPESYVHLREILGQPGVPVYCIPGNHDNPEAMARVLATPPFIYCGNHGLGPWRLVLLSTWDGDRGGGRLSDAELARFASSLEDTTEPHVLVVLHHHPVPVNSWLDKVALDNASDFLAIADSCARIRGILWGHVHQVWEGQRRGMRLLATPSTCFQFLPGATRSDVDPRFGPGWRWLELQTDGRIVTQVGWAAEAARFGT